MGRKKVKLINAKDEPYNRDIGIFGEVIRRLYAGEYGETDLIFVGRRFVFITMPAWKAISKAIKEVASEMRTLQYRDRDRNRTPDR